MSLPTAAHDEWLKATFGVDPAKMLAAGSSLPPAPQDKQGQEFHAKFDAALAPIDTALAYLGDHASDEKRVPVAARRDALIPIYKAALAKVDPADEAKGKPALAQALGGVSTVAAAAAAAQKVAEKAFADWTAREPKIEEAAGKIEEMEAWGYAKVAPLRAQLDAIKAPAEARSYEAAGALVDKLLQAMKPVVDDYEKQKAAQVEYDVARKALDPRLTATQTSTFHTLETQVSALLPAQSEMDAAASAKDYVQALELEKKLDGKVGEYEAALAKLQAAKKEYEDGLAAIEDKVNDHSQRPPPFHQMEKLQDDLEAARKQMQEAAEAEDFKGALEHCHELGGKADLVKQLRDEMEAKKKKFEEDDAKVEPRIIKASESHSTTLVPSQKEIANQKTQIDQAITAQDYEAASKALGVVEPMLDSFEKSVTELDQKKQEYKDKIKPIDEFFGTMAQSKHPKLKDDDQDLTDRHKQMTDAADKEDYVAASGFADNVQKGCEDYKKKLAELARLKIEFEQKWPGDLQKPLDEMKQSRTDELAPMQQGVLKLVDELNKVKDNEEYETGIVKVDTLKKALDDYNQQDETHVFTITLNSKPYSGTKKELAQAQMEVTNALASQEMPRLKRLADLHLGRLKGLVSNGMDNPLVFVMGAIVDKVAGADLSTVQPLVEAQFAAISACEKALTGNPKEAESNYRSAVSAINTAGSAISSYLDKIEGGAATVEAVAETIAVVAFALLAALAAPAVATALPSLGAVGANALAGAGAAGFETAVREGLGPLSVGDKVDGKEFGWKMAKSVGLGALGGLVGEAGMKSAVKGLVMAEAEKGLDKAAIEALVKSDFEKEVVKAIDGGIVGVATTIATATPEFFSDKNPMTWEKFAALIAVAFVTGALAPKIAQGKKLAWGANTPTVQ